MTDSRSIVFALLHVHIMPDGEEGIKVIGYYHSETDALEARGRAVQLPGFKDVPDGFRVERHVIDEDNPRKDYGLLSR